MGQERKSSIHIRRGEQFYLFHNSRATQTKNSIFSQENNEVDRNAFEALTLYENELKKRALAYTKRTGQRLQKKTITHFSAVVNLQEHHTLQDVKKVAKFLEQELDTKVFQIAVHKDEGHVGEEGNEIVNYHAHLEFLGLDSQGRSIRRKMNKKFLSNLQTQVALLLGMERGVKGSENKHQPAHIYKETAKRIEQERREKEKVLKALEKERKKRIELEEDLAKMKDLKELNKKLRLQLQNAHAQREHYAKLEALVRDLQERIRNKEITIKQLQERLHAKEKELIKEVEERRKAQKENEKLKQKVQELQKRIEELEAQLKQRTSMQERQKVRKDYNALKRELKTLLKATAEATGYNMPIATLAQNIADAVVDEIKNEELQQQNRLKRLKGPYI